MSHFIATENVFETIGNYPVVDQFDVDYTDLLSGSMTSRFISGSLFTYNRPVATAVAFAPSISFGQRGRAFDKLGVSKNSFPAPPPPTTPDPTSYQAQPWFERAGGVKVIKLLSDSERYYDSILPNIIDIIRIRGGAPVALDLTENITSITLGRNDAGVMVSFPFEPRHRSARRSKKNEYIVDRDTSGTSIIPRNIANVHIKFAPSDGSPGVTWGDTLAYGFASGQQPLTAEDFNKITFGYGDAAYLMQGNNNDFFGATSAFTDGFYYGSVVPRNFIFGGVWNVAGPIVRGWKYGLIDGNPHYTSCIFRRDKYGQFRDMLEQRLFSKFYVDPENSPSQKFLRDEGEPIPVSFSSDQKEFETESVVTVRFQTRLFENNKIRWISKAATQTSSSNVSTFCTASLPYFDGINRSR